MCVLGRAQKTHVRSEWHFEQNSPTLYVINPRSGENNRNEPELPNSSHGNAMMNTSANGSVFDAKNTDDIIIFGERDLNQTIISNPNTRELVHQNQSPQQGSDYDEQRSRQANVNLQGFVGHVVKSVDDSIAASNRVGMSQYHRPNSTSQPPG
jgi:hypothetical protein